MKNKETWFLLYGGTSADGRGPGRYIGRTTNKADARRHYDENKHDPRWVGGVRIITDTEFATAGTWTKWDNL